MESMDNRGDILFSSVIDHFSEETQQAREILRNIHFYQNARLPPGLSSPFADLSGISQEDHSILEKFFDQELKKVAEDTQSTQAGESTVDLNNVMQPWFPLARLPVVEDIARLMGRAKPSEESAYSFMISVLQQYHLVYYRGIFYCQENCIFRPVSEQELRSIIFPIVEPALAAGKNAKLIGNIIDLLKDCPYTKAYQTTETPDRIFFTNGVYDLVHHTLGPLQPTDFVTSYLPFQYIANNAACPEFDHFLIRISGGDNAIISLIWEMIGYLLSNDMSAKAFFVLQGVGDSGKSVLGNLISKMFNPEALANLDIYRFKDRFSTSALRGKRLNVCMDLPRAQISREAIGVIKMLTGDDTITIEEKFKSMESYKPTCKLLFGSNFPLMPADNDAAFRARLVVIPFQYSIPKEQQDKHLLEKLLFERSAIAVKAMDAYLRLKAQNYQFTQIQNTVTSMTAYVDDHEILERFLLECCEFSSQFYVFTSDLFEAYNQFRALNHIPPLSDLSMFSRHLNRFCAGRIQPKRRRSNGQNLNGYVGLKLIVSEDKNRNELNM